MSRCNFATHTMTRKETERKNSGANRSVAGGVAVLLALLQVRFDITTTSATRAIAFWCTRHNPRYNPGNMHSPYILIDSRYG
jgi:hypothetical protein